MAYCEYGESAGQRCSRSAARPLWWLVVSLLLAAPLQAQEQIVYVPPPDVDFAMPQNNQSGKDVRRQFGEPARVVAPVGEPPISRWHYADFTVYLEHDRVIIAVPRNN